MTGPYPTPRLTGSQPPAQTPACGSSLPSGAHCGQPATWHVLWRPGPGGSASLECQAHMDRITAHHTYWERHPAGPACSSAGMTWHPDHCTQE